MKVWPAAPSTPAANSQALKANKAPDSRYVPEIIFFRPTLSNRGPSSGLARLPTANARPYSGTALSLTP